MPLPHLNTIALSALVFAWAAAPAFGQALKGNAADGKILYEDCAGCHDMAGNGLEWTSTNKYNRRLTTIDPRSGVDAEVKWMGGRRSLVRK